MIGDDDDDDDDSQKRCTILMQLRQFNNFSASIRSKLMWLLFGPFAKNFSGQTLEYVDHKYAMTEKDSHLENETGFAHQTHTHTRPKDP